MTAERVKRPVRPTPAFRIVEKPTAAVKRERQRNQRRESRRMLGALGAFAFGATLFGLYIHEHAAVHQKQQQAARLAAKNLELEHAIKSLDRECSKALLDAPLSLIAHRGNLVRNGDGMNVLEPIAAVPSR